MRSAAISIAVLVALEGIAEAASDTDPDTSYGRFDGDLGLAGAVGITAGPRGPRATVDGRVRYLSTAGLFGTYEDGSLFGSSAEPRRAIAFGLELRPLFIARWGTGTELGLPRLDMLIDSLALELGAAFTQPLGERASFVSRAGLQAGIGLELPLFARTSGPFLGAHAGGRWSERALGGGPIDGPADRAVYATIVVGWQGLFGGAVLDRP